MSLNKPLIAELQHEAETTRRVLERVPESAWDWKPHEKSMSMSTLASHIAEMIGWTKIALETPELDFSKTPYAPFVPSNNKELMEFFEKQLAQALESLKAASDESFMQNWKMCNGEQVYFEMPRLQVVRSVILNHVIHHRGQLSVYLRLQNIPVPSIYGPSADEGIM
jgi:uncharacterized damage-inducible protein DinB